MNFHKRCAEIAPNLCCIDHTERRGRIRLNIKITEQKLNIQSNYNYLLEFKRFLILILIFKYLKLEI